MDDIKETNSRTYYHEEGFESGPAASVAIIAEIAVEAAGKPVYLYSEWIDVVDGYDYAVTSESLFDASKKMIDAASDEEQQNFSDEMDRIRRNDGGDRSPLPAYSG